MNPNYKSASSFLVPADKVDMMLDRYQKSSIKRGSGMVLFCAHCQAQCYYGDMNLLSLAICRNNPVCSRECQVALSQQMERI